jgi:2'-5' RNA ligase
MPAQLNSHDFEDMYKDLGYDINKLGCIMLDLEPQTFKINESVLYYAKNKDHFWIDGNVAAKTPHVTLLFGLLRSGDELKKHVDTVLPTDKLPKDVTIDHVGFFESPLDDEPYYCIVAHVKVTKEVAEARARLSFLPHIDTFAEYKPHFTLCYIKKNARIRDTLIGKLDDYLKGETIKATGINYGGDK